MTFTAKLDELKADLERVRSERRGYFFRVFSRRYWQLMREAVEIKGRIRAIEAAIAILPPEN